MSSSPSSRRTRGWCGYHVGALDACIIAATAVLPLDPLGTFAFSIGGDTLVVRKQLDLFGVPALSFAALLGAMCVSAGHALGLPATPTAIVGASTCFLLRYLAIRRNWRLPLGGSRHDRRSIGQVTQSRRPPGSPPPASRDPRATRFPIVRGSAVDGPGWSADDARKPVRFESSEWWPGAESNHHTRIFSSAVGDRGGSAHGVAGSAAVVLATLFEAVRRLPANFHTPVKTCPPVAVVRIPTFARAHVAPGEWNARGLTREEAQRTQLLRSLAARMACRDAYRMVGRVASAILPQVRPRGRIKSALL